MVSTEPGSPDPRDHPRRAELLEASVYAIRTEGPSVSMLQIATIGKVTKPILYRAFGSKEGLYQAVADWFVEQFINDIISAIGAELHLGEFIDALLETVLSRIETDAAVYHFLMRRARMALTSAQPAPEADFIRRFGDVVADFMAGRLTLAGRDPTPAPVWAHAVVGMINNAADWWLDHPEFAREDVVRWLAPVLTHGFEGALGPRPGPDPFADVEPSAEA